MICSWVLVLMGQRLAICCERILFASSVFVLLAAATVFPDTTDTFLVTASIRMSVAVHSKAYVPLNDRVLTAT